jgi:hypothetical protein
LPPSQLSYGFADRWQVDVAASGIIRLGFADPLSDQQRRRAL